DNIEHTYPVYKGRYETLSFEICNKKITIHAIPQCNTKKKYDVELKKLRPDNPSDYNIFVSHGSVTGVMNFSMNEFNELIIPAKILSRKFDYIALGHFHRYSILANNAYYSGSTESLTFTDANDKKGFIELALSDKKITTKFIEIKTRPMVDVKPIKCSNLKLEEIMKKIKEKVTEAKPKGKTIRITLDNISSTVYRSLDLNEIRKLTSDAIHYEIKVNKSQKEADEKQASSSNIDALVNEFSKFLDAQKIEDAETVKELGIGYIEKIQAREEGK
ncbi:MAG: metallophosphoesterase family protein, partial [Alphaproteobacteria bacterium]